MKGRVWKPGTPVIFRKLKHGSCPSPRARQVHPESRGERYLYWVDKFWIVLEHRDDNTLLILTRGGKRHLLPCDHPHLRRATWWEWLRFRDRFPRFEAGLGAEGAMVA